MLFHVNFLPQEPMQDDEYGFKSYYYPTPWTLFVTYTRYASKSKEGKNKDCVKHGESKNH